MVAVMALPLLIKRYVQDLGIHLHLTLRAVSIDYKLCSPTDHPNTETKAMNKVNDTTQQSQLEWQKEGDWGDSYQTHKQQTDTQTFSSK